jgi:hypothetical protein
MNADTVANEGTLLTLEQQEIVQLPWSTKALVIAGPGTGKTHVFIHRIRHLVESQQLLPGSQLLLLSFSRAAVYEIRRRLARLGGDAAYARAVTFDSFATQLLSSVNPNGTWAGGSYDSRIQDAVSLLAYPTAEVLARVGEVRHVIVDEVQDLVGVRANLVKAILSVTRGGFTLLGDPAQGIYTFQLPEPERYIGGHAVSTWARSRFGAELVRNGLSTNKRVQSDDAAKTGDYGRELNSDTPDYPSILASLSSTIRLLSFAGNPAQTLANAARFQKRFAVLCRNNGQALVLSSSLFDANVQHRLQRRATDRAVPGWVAHIARRLSVPKVDKSTVLDALNEVVLDPVNSNGSAVLEPVDAWLILRRFEKGGHAKAINFDQVAEAIRTGSIPDELIDLSESPIVLSTIHRAKGLEFDDVFLFESDIWGEPTPGAIAEEARVLYVALTRAKKGYWRINAPNSQAMRKENAPEGRWFEQGHEKWQTFGLELSGGDVDNAVPFGGSASGGSIQDYLRTNVRRGDVVSLICDGCIRTLDGCLGAYHVVHEGRDIGRTSFSFADAINRVLGRNGIVPSRWPVRIEGGRIDCVESVSGIEGKARDAGLGSIDIWLAPRLFGLGKLIWN